MFFCVSVAMTSAFDPVWNVPAKSPSSWLVTFRSVIVCRGPERSTWTIRTSALPYWFGPRTYPMPLFLPDSGDGLRVESSAPMLPRDDGAPPAQLPR